MNLRVEQNLLPERFEKNVFDLTPEERQFLVRLNDRLAELEQQIKSETLAMLEFGAQRVGKTALINDGYEVEWELDFFLKESDPARDDEQDNILARLSGTHSAGKDWSFGVADGENHNEFQYTAGHPLKDEFHCWLYHDLYHHATLDLPDGRRRVDVDWGNLLRIGSTFLDLKLWFQSSTSI